MVQFDLPISRDEMDTYVHRIGRTGRAGRSGKATALFVPGDEPKIGNGVIWADLVALLEENQQQVPDWFEECRPSGVAPRPSASAEADAAAVSLRRKGASENRRARRAAAAAAAGRPPNAGLPSQGAAPPAAAARVGSRSSAPRMALGTALDSGAGAEGEVTPGRVATSGGSSPRGEGEEPRRRCLAGLVQMTSINDAAANFGLCKKLTDEAVQKGCRLVFFPECFSFMGARAGEAQAVAEPLDGPILGWYKQLAREASVWLSLGGFQEIGPEGDPRIYNTHVVLDSDGRLAAAYRKIHLFDVPMVGLVESSQTLAGCELVSCDSPAGRLGLAICYDLRFPEMHQKLTFTHGAEVLTFPSAFAMKTGEAHWETLLRCRAIECQTYVVAAAQVGQHNEHGNKRQSWGHAMAVDPWGKVVAQFGGAGDVGVMPFEIDLDLVQKTRDNMPMHTHRRYDLYGDQAVDSGRSLVGGSRTGSVKMVLDGTDSGSIDDNGGGKGGDGGGGGGKGGGGGGLASNSIEAQILAWIGSNEGQTALAAADDEGWDFVDEDEEEEDEEDEDEDEEEVPFEERAVVAASRAPAPGPSAPEPAAPKPAAPKLETPTASSPKSSAPKPAASQVATSSAPKPIASRAAKSPAPKPAVSRVVSTKRTKSTKPAPGASKRRA